MRKLVKLHLKNAEILSSEQMKKINGGITYTCVCDGYSNSFTVNNVSSMSDLEAAIGAACGSGKYATCR